MKKATLLRLIFFVSFIIFAGVINKSNAQVKKSNPDIFFPDRKRTSPTTRKNYPVWTNTQRRSRNVNNLPPGQQKKYMEIEAPGITRQGIKRNTNTIQMKDITIKKKTNDIITEMNMAIMIMGKEGMKGIVAMAMMIRL